MKFLTYFIVTVQAETSGGAASVLKDLAEIVPEAYPIVKAVQADAHSLERFSQGNWRAMVTMEIEADNITDGQSKTRMIALNIEENTIFISSVIYTGDIFMVGSKIGTLATNSPKNENLLRGHLAGKILAEFAARTAGDLDSALVDLLTNLMHWADATGAHFDDVLEIARAHHDAELSEAA